MPVREPITVARDLMIPLDVYPHIGSDASIADAILAFTGAQIERKGRLSLPRIVLVFDEDDRLIGLIRRRDIMRGLLPGFLIRDKGHPAAHYDFPADIDLDLADLLKGDFKDTLAKNSQAPIAEILQDIAGSVDADANILDLVKEMVQSEFHVLPVTENDHVIGVVRTVEVLNNVRRILGLQ